MQRAYRRVWQHEAFRWATTAGAALVLLGAAALLALKLTPDWFASDRFPDRRCVLGNKSYKECLDTAKARADDRRGVTTATLAIFAGALSAFGAVYTAKTFRQNRESAERTHDLDRAGQLTERFTRAVDQLGNAQLDVRLGGIYALERIARDSPEDHPQVVEVLTAYVREHAPWPLEPGRAAEREADSVISRLVDALEGISYGPQPEIATEGTDPPGEAASPQEDRQRRLATDIQAALSVLGRRKASQDAPGTELKLAGTDLQRLELAKRRDDDPPPHLEDANLAEANLRHAHLAGTNLHNAYLAGARLEEASLRDADLSKAVLVQAQLNNATLTGANLQGAKLPGADLSGADLQRVQLQGAAFRGGAYFRDAVLEWTKVEDALYDDDTTWPEGFDYEAAGARHVNEGLPPPDSVPPPA
jgi:uncharacterized protein YjbI with pentapeptide repeats